MRGTEIPRGLQLMEESGGKFDVRGEIGLCHESGTYLNPRLCFYSPTDFPEQDTLCQRTNAAEKIVT
jgi:hypothetical protein